MMICTQTGNGLDVACEAASDGQSLILCGLYRRPSYRHPQDVVPRSEIIPLPDPQGLIDVLARVLREIEEHNAAKKPTKKRTKRQ